MIKLIKVYRNSRILELGKIDTLGFGIENDNKVDILRFQFDEFVDGVASLLTDLEDSNGEKVAFPMTKNIEENSYDIEIIKEMLVNEELTIQIMISSGNEVVWHSKTAELECDRSLYASSSEMPTTVEMWLQKADMKLAEYDLHEAQRTINEETRIENDRTREINEETRIRNEEERIDNENLRELYISELKQDVEQGKFDGADFEYNWQGTQLGVKTSEETEYQYVDLKGDKGDKGDKGETGDVNFITFEIDIDTGELVMNKAETLESMSFEIDNKGYLNVVI